MSESDETVAAINAVPAGTPVLEAFALVAIGKEPETIDLRLRLLANRVGCLGNMGRMVEIERAIGEALAAAERSGTSPSQVIIRLQTAASWYATGRWDDAVAELDAVDELPQSPAWQLFRHGWGAMIASDRDDRPALSEHARAVEHLDLNAGDLRYYSRQLVAAQAVAAERDGQPERALASMLSAVDMIYPVPGGGPTLGNDWLPDVVRLALTVGDIATAAVSHWPLPGLPKKSTGRSWQPLRATAVVCLHLIRRRC